MGGREFLVIYLFFTFCFGCLVSGIKVCDDDDDDELVIPFSILDLLLSWGRSCMSSSQIYYACVFFSFNLELIG